MACQFLVFLNRYRKLCAIILTFLSKLSSIMSTFLENEKLGTHGFSNYWLPYNSLTTCFLSLSASSTSSPPAKWAVDKHECSSAPATATKATEISLVLTAAGGAGKIGYDFYVFSLFSENTLHSKSYNLSLDSIKKDTLLDLLKFVKYFLD